jgi:23S rRNA-/tRNA-specific pseudouridylate synthase
MNKQDMLKPSLLSETTEWIAVNKPEGWLSIAGRGDHPVLFEWVRASFPTAQVVHRLDRETSGVILFAKTPEAHKKANLWFQNRQTKKLYCCLASGQASQPILAIRKPIEGAPSSTQVEVKEEFESSFFAWVRPQTGRRHQIRIHLAGEGNPLLGDSLYGGPKGVVLKTEGSQAVNPLEISRVALHAMSLEFPSGEKFQAPIPADFEEWLTRLRAGN